MVTVCRALVDEVNYAIGKVDPKKTIQVGSFRVDSKGNQGTYEVRIQEMKRRTFTCAAILSQPNITQFQTAIKVIIETII